MHTSIEIISLKLHLATYAAMSWDTPSLLVTYKPSLIITLQDTQLSSQSSFH